MVIPYIRWKEPKYAYNGPFLFTPIIFVDKDLISFGGEVVYGFPKRIGQFSVSDTAYAVLDTAWPSDYVRTSIQDTTNSVTPQGREMVTNLLQQPSVSQNPTARELVRLLVEPRHGHHHRRHAAGKHHAVSLARRPDGQGPVRGIGDE